MREDSAKANEFLNGSKLGIFSRLMQGTKQIVLNPFMSWYLKEEFVVGKQFIKEDRDK